MRIAILAVLVTACSTTPERYDYSGTTTAPPAYTPAGAGAPTHGQPGDVSARERAPRSTNRRPVTPRRDGQPQLMAADGDDARAVELMLSAPVPATPEGISPSAWAKCWRDFQRLAREDERVSELTHPEAKCLRNIVVSHCGARMIEQAENGNIEFLRRFPERPMAQPEGRTSGTYSSHAFAETMDGRRNARVCGPNHEYWTRAVSEIAVAMSEHGDDEMDWRNP